MRCVLAKVDSPSRQLRVASRPNTSNNSFSWGPSLVETAGSKEVKMSRQGTTVQRSLSDFRSLRR